MSMCARANVNIFAQICVRVSRADVDVCMCTRAHANVRMCAQSSACMQCVHACALCARKCDQACACVPYVHAANLYWRTMCARVHMRACMHVNLIFFAENCGRGVGVCACARVRAQMHALFCAFVVACNVCMRVCMGTCVRADANMCARICLRWLCAHAVAHVHVCACK